MSREKGIDIVILFLNVVAIVVLVGILSVMVNTSEAMDASPAANAGNYAGTL